MSYLGKSIVAPHCPTFLSSTPPLQHPTLVLSKDLHACYYEISQRSQRHRNANLKCRCIAHTVIILGTAGSHIVRHCLEKTTTYGQ